MCVICALDEVLFVSYVTVEKSKIDFFGKMRVMCRVVVAHPLFVSSSSSRIFDKDRIGVTICLVRGMNEF